MADGNGNGKRSRIRTYLIALAILILYAYATQATKIDLQEPLKPRRQSNLVSLIRELAHPDLFAYETQTRSTNISIRMPCPEDVKASTVTVEGRELAIIPNCVTTTQDSIGLDGQGFQPNASGVIRWYPFGATSTRTVADFKADAQGQFSIDFTMPDVRPSDEPQRLEVLETVDRRIVGPSDTALEALDKIVETVFMALMASTIGTALAIPISFMAARNLMRDVRLPLAAIMGGLVLAPVGGFAGWWVANQVVTLSNTLAPNGLVGLGAFAVSAVLLGLAVRFSPIFAREIESRPSSRVSIVWSIIIGLLALLSFSLLARSGLLAGGWLSENLGPFGFLGNFIQVLSDLTNLLAAILVGLGGVFLALALGSRYGQEAVIRMPDSPGRVLTAVLAAAGTAILIIGLALGLFWLDVLGVRPYVPETVSDQLNMMLVPTLIVSGVVALLSALRPPKRQYPIGMTTYTVTRGTLNGLRSIEPIMMGFVFVVWVGLGPFAGILALTLHSIADLGKLFSEQVENIEEGPREAIRATGANTIQSIVYAVVPQITPHYIAYIFYRWDINVRMSTIIGFVGGGGIGFVLQRYLNQLQYTRASVMVIAIALVVTVLDNVSSRIRRRIT
jgi:phosphonate ABC transporter permease subunit PhnE